MVAEKTKKMPKGVGKRIIENLKGESQDFDQAESVENSAEEQKVEAVAEETEITENIPEEKQEEQPYEEEEEYPESQEIAQETEPIQANQESEEPSEPIYPNAGKSRNNAEMSDIDTLLNLITRLPSGVTKQTGALIIRQTMEAMGIPMNNVLSNAQSVQEDLENSIRNNVNVIEEYRTKIKILEQEIQQFRKKAHELEDIISLFILSEDKK